MTCVIDTYELSPMQAGMLFHSVSGGEPGVYAEQVVAKLCEPLDETQFLRAWQRVVERHAAFRSRFRWEGVAEPMQEVVDRVQIPLERFDWRAAAEAERQQRFQALLDHERLRGFDLDQAPLMRLVLVRAAEHVHWVLLTMHHAVMDGRSRFLLWREIFIFYEAFLRGEDADVPLPRAYREHIEWLGRLDYDSAKPYWQGLLAGFRAPTSLVVARGREAESVTGGARGTHEILLTAPLTAALKQRAREASVTLNILLQGAWALLLHRYCGEADIVFGVTRACRGSGLDGAKDMFGLFINTLPIRVRIDPESELVPWLRQLWAQHVALREREHTPLPKILGWSDVPRGTPLFESILVFDHHTLDEELRALDGARGERRFLNFGHTNYPLTVVAYGNDQLVLQIEYSRKRFDDAVVARMLGHLQSLLEGMAACPQSRLKDLPLLTDAEQRQAISGWNIAASLPQGPCLHERFERQVERTPDAVALVYEGQRLSYAELNRRANRLAHQLRELGVTPDQLVGLRIERELSRW